jgi:hypothetical protein
MGAGSQGSREERNYFGRGMVGQRNEGQRNEGQRNEGQKQIERLTCDEVQYALRIGSS